MNHSNRFYLGPPGTGKTYRCIRVAGWFIGRCHVKPIDIAYLSFTKIAASEAYKRINKKFNDIYDETQFANFRTLHSMCLRNVPEITNIMGKSDYVDFGENVPINFDTKLSWEAEEDDRGVLKVDNPYLRLIQLANNRLTTLEEQYILLKTKEKDDIDFTKLIELNEHYKKYKQDKDLYDFDDMLLYFSKLPDNLIPHFPLFIIDEAQDCSKLQWLCINKLIARADRTIIAGDDDQAIYVWSGADVTSFRAIEHRPSFKTKILKNSRRVPKLQHALAQKIIQRDTQRIKKEYFPTKEEGTVSCVQSDSMLIDWIQQAYEKELEILILCTYNKPLRRIGKLLQHYNLKYTYKKEGTGTAIVQAIKDWKALHEGKTISCKRVKKVYAQLETDVSVARGYKSGKKAPDDLEQYSLQDLIDKYGLLSPCPLWQEEFSKMSMTDKMHYTDLEERGKDLETRPQIKLSTINSIKGSEREVVFLLDDLSGNEQTEEEINELHRKMYVGVTRSSQHLIIVEARYTWSRDFYYGLWHTWKEVEYEQRQKEISLRQSSRRKSLSEIQDTA